MDRRNFLKGAFGGLALTALANSYQVAEASPRLRLLPMRAIPRRVKTIANRFTADVIAAPPRPLHIRPGVLRYRAASPWWPHFTGWIFFFGPEEAADDVDLMLSVGVPDDPNEPVFIELARLTAGEVQVYKDSEPYVKFEYVALDYLDEPLPGFCLGFPE